MIKFDPNRGRFICIKTILNCGTYQLTYQWSSPDAFFDLTVETSVSKHPRYCMVIAYQTLDDHLKNCSIYDKQEDVYQNISGEQLRQDVTKVLNGLPELQFDF